MSGYDFSSKHPQKLLMGRMGIFDKKPYSPESNTLDGVQDQSNGLRVHGGHLQQERMIRDKRRSLDRALWFSYQAAEILNDERNGDKPIRALINPDKTKQNYDDKILSVGYEYGFQPGDVFEWKGTDTHWLIYLQDLTELAYFRGEIRKCSYEIDWEDENGLHSTYAAIRGPVETKINFIQKHSISVDQPNLSLDILMPKNKDTLSYFKRYSKFYLQDYNEGAEKVCWRVEALDWISMPGILQLSAVEYYANETEDDIEAGIVEGKIDIKEKNPNDIVVERAIKGPTFIKPKTEYEFHYTGIDQQKWRVDAKKPIILTPVEGDPYRIVAKWNSNYSGQFTLSYGDFEKTIVIESLF